VYYYALIDVITAKCKWLIQLFFDAVSSDTVMYIAKCYGGTITYLFTPCSRVLVQNLNGYKTVKKFPAFYGTQKFITAFTSARSLSLS